MESILSELGAVNENESDVQRNILRERILKAVRFPKPIGDETGSLEPVKVIGGAPISSPIGFGNRTAFRILSLKILR